MVRISTVSWKLFVLIFKLCVKLRLLPRVSYIVLIYTVLAEWYNSSSYGVGDFRFSFIELDSHFC